MHYLLLLSLLVLPSHMEDAKPIYKSKTIALIDRYLPEYHNVMSEHLYYPENGVKYVNNKRVPNPTPTEENEILKEMGTIVHESIHHYNSRERVFVEPGETYIIELESVMHSRKMVDFLKQSCDVDSIFRFKSYLGAEALTQVSNQYGIVGLLDEYSAYYHGCKASLEFWKNGQKSLNKEQLNSLKQDAMATYFACYEFELFMGSYLAYTKKYEPEIYRQTVASTSLKKAYSALHTRFNALCKEIESTFSEDYSLEYYQEKHTAPAKRALAKFEVALKAITLDETQINASSLAR